MMRSAALSLALFTFLSLCIAQVDCAFAGVRKNSAPILLQESLKTHRSHGTVGESLNTLLTASGGFSPYIYSVTGGELPPGLSLSVDGMLSGTLTAAGRFRFEVTATDANGKHGSHAYYIHVSNATMFQDDFDDNDVSDWRPDRGKWSASDRAMHGISSRKAENFPRTLVNGCTMCSMEAELVVEAPETVVSLLTFYADRKNYVDVRLIEDVDRLVLRQFVNGKRVVKEAYPLAITPGTTYQIEVDFLGGEFQVYADGKLIIKRLTPIPPAGTLGVRVKPRFGGSQSAASFNEVLVTD